MANGETTTVGKEIGGVGVVEAVGVVGVVIKVSSARKARGLLSVYSGASTAVKSSWVGYLISQIIDS
ncbi:MAG: hypothetical protein HC780_17250 [Leptolyngbyaceae cyanobacterium CSU_1_3]|nr:hypothetical protein [Leptolyngbyaceae cyanobacterium CSU_1_3]